MKSKEKTNLKLVPMTRELYHNMYRHFENDPAVFAENFREYVYNEDNVNKSFDEEDKDNRRILFAVSVDDNPVPIGVLKLKYIDYEKKQCSMGISLTNDSVKNKGYGTEAEKLALKYAFNKLGMTRVNADAILKNKRSQHVMEKVGFEYVREDEMFKYYVCPASKYTK